MSEKVKFIGIFILKLVIIVGVVEERLVYCLLLCWIYFEVFCIESKVWLFYEVFWLYLFFFGFFFMVQEFVEMILIELMVCWFVGIGQWDYLVFVEFCYGDFLMMIDLVDVMYFVEVVEDEFQVFLVKV